MTRSNEKTKMGIVLRAITLAASLSWFGVGASAALAGDSSSGVFGSIPACPIATSLASYSYCDPVWSVSVGPMYLHRSAAVGGIIFPSAGPGTLIDASNYDYGWNPSLDSAFSLQIWNGWTLEGRYFDTSSGASANLANVTTFREAGIGVTILGGGSVNTQATTGLTSTEANIAKQVFPGLTLLAGLRRIALTDNVNTQLSSPGIYVNWADSNALKGGQIGARVSVIAPWLPLEFDATGKTGIYRNAASNVMTANLVGGASDARTQNATVNEVDLDLSYHVDQHLAIKVGYMGLWMNKLTLAGEAAAGTSQVPGGSSSPVQAGSLFYNGVTASAVVSF